MNAKIMKGKSAGGLIDYLNSMKEKNAKVIFSNGISTTSNRTVVAACKQFFQDKGQDGTSGNQFLAQRPGKAD